MLDFIDSADDVIAVRVADRISGDELDTIMDRLDGAMARYDKVHVFVETRSIDGIEIAGLGAYMARAMPLLGKLDRFGRVAVVADQAWIRAVTDGCVRKSTSAALLKLWCEATWRNASSWPSSMGHLTRRPGTSDDASSSGTA